MGKKIETFLRSACGVLPTPELRQQFVEAVVEVLADPATVTDLAAAIAARHKAPE